MKRVCHLCKQERIDKEFPTPTSNQCRKCKLARARDRVARTPESYLEHLIKRSKTRAKTRKVKDEEYTLTLQDLVDLWERQKGRCALSNIVMTHHKDGQGPIDHNVSIDRKDVNVGYTPENTQLVCYRANIMRHSLSQGMFYWWVKTIHDFSCN
jgi:hypothetical protein